MSQGRLTKEDLDPRLVEEIESTSTRLEEVDERNEQHTNDLDNPHGVTAEQLALGNVQNFGVATQEEAESGTSSTKYMTPLGTKQAVIKNLAIISQSLNDLEEQVSMHLDETVSQIKTGTRDASLAGIQTFDGLTGKPKRIEIRSAKHNGLDIEYSLGSWESGNHNTSVNVYKHSQGHVVSSQSFSHSIACANNETNYLLGKIQNVTSTSFDVLWEKTGAPQGLTYLQFIIHYHGEESL